MQKRCGFDWRDREGIVMLQPDREGIVMLQPDRWSCCPWVDGGQRG
ncbi:MAG: hypothetical protein VKL01_00815 [Limnothrix sp.]|nr:hypothetical protein [Limnothrix sp.]